MTDANTSQIKIVYFGTANFAVPPLIALLSRPEIFTIAAVVSQPDRPAGRQSQLKISPIVQLARKNNLALLQPEKITPEFITTLQKIKADLFAVAAYGLILPKKLLEIPSSGAVNLHGSLLPRYRGASPIQTCLLNGEMETGVTLISMDEKMDHGPIIASCLVPIADSDDYESLTKKLSEAAAELLVNSLPAFVSGQLKPQPQDHSSATFTKILKKEDGRINWNSSAHQIERQILALRPWPGTFAEFNNRRIKILNVETLKTVPTEILSFPGIIKKSEDNFPLVATADRWIKLLVVQPEGKKIMSGRDFLHGYPDIIQN
jgi:methionyl-tRNA formyltransferase